MMCPGLYKCLAFADWHRASVLMVELSAVREENSSGWSISLSGVLIWQGHCQLFSSCGFFWDLLRNVCGLFWVSLSKFSPDELNFLLSLGAPWCLLESPASLWVSWLLSLPAAGKVRNFSVKFTASLGRLHQDCSQTKLRLQLHRRGEV